MPQKSNSVEAAVDKATNEYNVTEDWQQIMDLCDAIKTGAHSPKDALKYIMKRVQHRVPHVSIQALSLLDACVNNCGKPFHLEICSRDWTSEARQIVFKAHPKVSEKLKKSIKQWTNDFKDDPQLSLMGKLYSRLQSEGLEFPSGDDASSGAAGSQTVLKRKDELGFKEDLDLAIALSLQESDVQPKATSASLYPSMNPSPSSQLPTTQSQSIPQRVKALYDFEAAEDNELSFKAGELIGVLDSSDENWWKGENHRGIGLFPANFVTSDLSEPKPVEKKHVRFVDQVKVQASPDVRSKPEISQDKLDLCMSMLKNASPTEEDDEEETIQGLEVACQEMKPLLLQDIDETDKKKLQLEEIQEKFSQALSMYQSLMKEPIPTAMAVPPSYSSVQQSYQPMQQSGHVPYGQPQQHVPPYSHMMTADASLMARPPAYDHVVPPGSLMTAQPRINYPSYPSQGPAAAPTHGMQQQQYPMPPQLDSQMPVSCYSLPQNGMGSYAVGDASQQHQYAAPASYGHPSSNIGAPGGVYPQAPVYQ